MSPDTERDPYACAVCNCHHHTTEQHTTKQTITNSACPCWSGYHLMHRPTCGCPMCDAAAPLPCAACGTTDSLCREQGGYCCEACRTADTHVER